jgi:TolB-like protein
MACLAAVPQAWAQQRPADAAVRVAIMRLNAATLGGSHDLAALSEALTTMIITEFSDRGTAQIMERDRVDAIMDQHFAGMSGRVNDRVAVDVGRMLGVEYVVFGGVTMSGGEARFDMRIVDVETGEIHRSFGRRVRESQFLDTVESLADHLLTGLKLPQRVVEVPVPPTAIVAYSRGLDFERRGQRERAAELFRRALEIHPQHRDAAAALARVR